MAETGVIVIDVPESTSSEEASRVLNAPGDSYFLVQVLPVAGGHRAYLRRYKQTTTKTQIARANGEAVDDVAALSVVRANRDKSVRVIVSLLEAAGIKRGRQWVCDQLTATCAEDGREDEALAYVKKWCGPNYTAKDVVDELRYIKIRRSAAWARQKLEAVRADKS